MAKDFSALYRPKNFANPQKSFKMKTHKFRIIRTKLNPRHNNGALLENDVENEIKSIEAPPNDPIMYDSSSLSIGINSASSENEILSPYPPDSGYNTLFPSANPSPL